MLVRVLELNKVITELKEKSWQIEDRFRELEQQIQEVEGLCPKKFTRDEKKKGLDFRDIKIPELNKRLEILEKNHPKPADDNYVSQVKEMRGIFDKSKAEYKKILELLQAPTEELDNYNKKILCESLPKLRREMNAIVDKKVMLEYLSNLDGSVSLEMLILIDSELKNITENDLILTFSQAFERNLRSKNNESFDEICHRVMGTDIKSIFQEFTKKDAKEMVEEKLQEKIQEIHERFWKGVLRVYKIPFAEESIEAQTKRKQFFALFNNFIYLTCTIETYKFTDEIQKTSLGGAIWGTVTGGVVGQFRKMSVDQIVNPYLAIPLCARQILPQANTQDLFQESFYWIKGLYQRSYNQLPHFYREEGDKVKLESFEYRGDDEDRKFYDNKEPLTKIQIAIHHKPHYEALFAKLQLTAQLKPMERRAGPVAKPAAGVSKPSAQQQQYKVQPLSDIIPNVSQLFPSKTAALQAKKGLLPFRLLEEMVDPNTNDDVRFSMLVNALSGYDLSETQKLMVTDFKDAIVKVLNPYTEAWFSTHWVPTSFKKRPHTDKVKSALIEIESTDKPAEYIRSLHTLWTVLKTGGSVDVGPKVTDLLRNFLSLIHKAAKPTAEQRLA